jgi:hypothetical protein
MTLFDKKDRAYFKCFVLQLIEDPDQVHMGDNFIPNIELPKVPSKSKSPKTVRRKGSGAKGGKPKSKGRGRKKVSGKKRYVMHIWILDVDSLMHRRYVRKNPANIFVQKKL